MINTNKFIPGTLNFPHSDRYHCYLVQNIRNKMEAFIECSSDYSCVLVIQNTTSSKLFTCQKAYVAILGPITLADMHGNVSAWYKFDRAYLPRGK